MFSGGSYEDVARWLRNFLVSHAKREDPRVEVVLEAGDAREGVSYAARLRRGERLSAPMEFDYKDVADNRGALAWCAALAQRTREQARELLAATGLDDARAR
jgi:hypothetical protein